MIPAQHRKKVAAGLGIATVTASLVTFIHAREGVKYRPYRDIVGIWTACGGVTGPDVIPGKTYTVEECDALDGAAIKKHGEGLLACLTRPVTQNQYEALASWTYNIGVGAACNSTVVRQINAGDPPSVWCRGLLKWNKAGGKEVRGLTSRRRDEVALCLS